MDWSQYKDYRKKNVQPMRPYVEGEDMTGISVNKEDTPEVGGMVAANIKNPEDKWYCSVSERVIKVQITSL